MVWCRYEKSDRVFLHFPRWLKVWKSEAKQRQSLPSWNVRNTIAILLLDAGKFHFVFFLIIYLQEDEKDKDEEFAKKVHNALNNITDEKAAAETPTEGAPAASGPSMNS